MTPYSLKDRGRRRGGGGKKKDKPAGVVLLLIADRFFYEGERLPGTGEGEGIFKSDIRLGRRSSPEKDRSVREKKRKDQAEQGNSRAWEGSRTSLPWSTSSPTAERGGEGRKGEKEPNLYSPASSLADEEKKKNVNSPLNTFPAGGGVP